jgi:hypothetical protein
MLFDLGFNDSDQLRHACKYTSRKHQLFRLRKKRSTIFSHDAEVGVKWMWKHTCLVSHLRDFGMLVGGIVVADSDARFCLWCFPVDLAQKRQPLTVPRVGLTLGHDLAVQNIECCKQRGGAIAFIIMVMVAAHPFFKGNPGWVRSSA